MIIHFLCRRFLVFSVIKPITKQISVLTISLVVMLNLLTINTNRAYAQEVDGTQSIQSSDLSNTPSSSPSDILAGQEDGRTDAQKNINKTGWFFAGCLGGVAGWIISMIVEPNPPATKLLGKSPEYVAAYIDAYRLEGKNIQKKSALSGCLLEVGVSLALQLIILSATPTN